MTWPLPALADPHFALDATPTRHRLHKHVDYDTALATCQENLRRLQLGFLHQEARGIVVFEGWDASGKGGVIRRMAAVLEPRACDYWSIGPPQARWRGRHYMERFWPRLPGPGRMGVFDRSWYGRVLVERVENLADEDAWRRAYDEINAFEAMLLADGIRLVKIFLHVSPEEQLHRFQRRLNDPLKRWKLTPSDVRNRELRDAYGAAIEEMIRRTSTVAAPWTVIPGDDKKYARIRALELIFDRLSEGLDLAPAPLSDEFAGMLAQHLGLKLPEEPR